MNVALHRSGLSQYLHTALSASAGVQLGTDDYSSAVDYASNPAIETGMVLSRSAGGVYLFDHDGVLRYAKDNEMPFVNLRRVENLVTAAQYSSYIDGAAAGSTPPSLANTIHLGRPCFSITFPSGASGFGASRYSAVFSSAIEVTKKYASRVEIALSRPLSGLEEVRFRLYSNTVNLLFPIITAAHPANVAGAWVMLGGQAVNPGGVIFSLDAWCATTINSAITIYVRAINIVDKSGSSVLHPDEDVSVGVLSPPYHGAGVDAVKYFATTNGNTANATTYILTEAAGTALTSGAVKVEGQGANLLAEANCRDFSTWASVGVSMAATTPALLDGTIGTSAKNEILEDTGNTEHGKTLTFTAATAGKQSVMIAIDRGTGARHAQLRVGNATDGIYGAVAVNLDTLAVIGSATAEYWTAYVKGNYTIIELVDSNTTTGTQTIYVNIHDGASNSYTGDGTSTLILDWAQVVTSGLAQSHVQGAATRYSSFFYRPWIGATIDWWIYVDFIFLFSSQALVSGVNYYAISLRADVNNASTLRFITGGSGLIRINSTNQGVTQIADVSNFSVDRGDRCRAVLSFDSVNGLRCRVRNGESAAQTAQVTTSKAPIAALASNTNLYLGSLDGLTVTTVLQSELRAHKVGAGRLSVVQMTALVGA